MLSMDGSRKDILMQVSYIETAESVHIEASDVVGSAASGKYP